VFIVVVVYFVIDSVRKLLDTPSYISTVVSKGTGVQYSCAAYTSFKDIKLYINVSVHIPGNT
jgi:hypothetical protein